MTPRVNCIGYARVSTERQAGEVQTSLSDQHKAIEHRAAKLGLTLGRMFTDAGASGGDENRPEFVAMRKFCEASPRSQESPGTILVLNDSRWGRYDDAETSTFWRVWFAELGWRVRFVENDAEDTTANAVTRAIGSP